MDFFEGQDSTYTPYKTERFKDSFRLRTGNDPRLSLVEYVEMLRDVIKLGKNLVVCRGMAGLDKGVVGR